MVNDDRRANSLPDGKHCTADSSVIIRASKTNHVSENEPSPQTGGLLTQKFGKVQSNLMQVSFHGASKIPNKPIILPPLRATPEIQSRDEFKYINCCYS